LRAHAALHRLDRRSPSLGSDLAMDRLSLSGRADALGIERLPVRHHNPRNGGDAAGTLAPEFLHLRLVRRQHGSAAGRPLREPAAAQKKMTNDEGRMTKE